MWKKQTDKQEVTKGPGVSLRTPLFWAFVCQAIYGARNALKVWNKQTNKQTKIWNLNSCLLCFKLVYFYRRTCNIYIYIYMKPINVLGCHSHLQCCSSRLWIQGIFSSLLYSRCRYSPCTPCQLQVGFIVFMSLLFPWRTDFRRKVQYCWDSNYQIMSSSWT